LSGILYGVSPIGLGHASRAAAVALRLRELGVEVEFATGGNAVPFLRSYDLKVSDIVTEPVPSETRGVMRNSALWYLKYWRGYRATRRRMAEFMHRLRPKLVVGDEEFTSVSLALEQKIDAILVSDELELEFARSFFSRFIERRVSVWYKQMQQSVPHLVVPDFGEDSANIHHVPPVVRTVGKNRREVLEDLKIEQTSKMILLSASGSGIGKFLLDSTLKALRSLELPEVKLVVTGLAARRSGDVFYLGTYRDNQNLVAAADLVI
jgi:predicted glycosyltransferase